MEEELMGNFGGPNQASWPGKAVVAFTQLDYKILRDLLPAGKEKKPLWGMTRLTMGEDFILTGPVLGAPQAAMVLETLGRRGVREFVSLGWCGAVQPGVAWGEIILPDSVLVEEGTSPLYQGDTADDLGPDPDLTAGLEAILRKRGTAFRRGRIWTTDAPYRETRAKVVNHAGSGVLGVDMETSAMMAVSRFRQLAWTGLLVVSDELWREKWRPGFHSPELKDGLQAAAGAIVEWLAGRGE